MVPDEDGEAARGLQGPEVGIALRAVSVMIDSGLMLEEQHGGHESRVGLNRDRRDEIADIIGGKPIVDEKLGGWLAER